MNLNDLIKEAARVYPDELLLQYWDDEKQQPKDNPNAGDTLALFIVREIADTYDPNIPDDEQLVIAIGAMNRAANEIERVANLLQNLALPVIRQRQKPATGRVYLKDGDMVEAGDVTFSFRKGRLKVHDLADACLAWWDEANETHHELKWDKNRLYYEP